VKLHLFYDYVSDFRLFLERSEASLKGFTVFPSFSQSLQVLKPIPCIPHHVVGSSGRQGTFGTNGDEVSDDSTDTSSDVAEIEGLLEMDWDSD
jgi:hypothetical protein